MVDWLLLGITTIGSTLTIVYKRKDISRFYTELRSWIAQRREKRDAMRFVHLLEGERYFVRVVGYFIFWSLLACSFTASVLAAPAARSVNLFLLTSELIFLPLTILTSAKLIYDDWGKDQIANFKNVLKVLFIVVTMIFALQFTWSIISAVIMFIFDTSVIWAGVISTATISVYWFASNGKHIFTYK